MNENNDSTNYAIISVVTLYIAVFLNSFSGMINDFVMIRYLDVQFNRNADGFGLVIGAFFLGKIVSLFLIGKLSDIFGRKIMLIIVFIFYLIGSLFAPLSPNFSWFIVGRLIKGFASYESVGLALINDYFEKEVRNDFIGYFNVSAIGGYFIGGIVASFFLIWFTDLANFWILIGINGFVILLVICFIKEPKINISIENVPNLPDIKKKKDIEAKSTMSKKIIKLMNKIRNYAKIPTYISTLMIALFFGIIFSGSSSQATYIILNYYEIQPEWLSGIVVQSINLIVTITVMIFGKRHQFRKYIRQSVILFVIISPLSLILLWNQNLLVFLLLIYLQAFLMGMIYPSLDNWISLIVDEKTRGEKFGLYKTFYFLGSAIGSTLFGYVGEIIWNFAPFLLNGVFALMILLIITCSWNKKAKIIQI